MDTPTHRSKGSKNTTKATKAPKAPKAPKATKTKKGTRSRDKPLRSRPIPKLKFMELPKFYDTEPLFWRPLFKKNELLELKERLQALLDPDIQLRMVNKEMPEMWNVCKIVKRFFPSFFVPLKNKSYTVAGGYTRDQEVDYMNYQIICCTSMLLFGILSARLVLHDQDYRLLFKGGKAIQMELPNEYITEDIDIVVDPIHEYDPIMIENLSGHLSLLIQWLIPFRTSILPPGENPHLYKLSFHKSDGLYRPFADIDFKEIEKEDTFFRDMVTEQYYIEPLEEHALFTRPTLQKILEEKLFYYTKYKIILHRIQQGEVIEGVTKKNCIYLMDKFERGILAIAPDIKLNLL